jgi:hypothetical protein
VDIRSTLKEGTTIDIFTPIKNKQHGITDQSSCG